jgi:hypothetical protein
LGFYTYPLKKVISELKDKWKRDIKTDDSDAKPESAALNVNDRPKKKWNTKQFKRNGRKCGK